MYKMSVYFYFYEDEMLYIGSTFDLNRRKIGHKTALKCGNTMPFYKYLREHNLTFDNLRIEIVETAIYEKEPLFILENMFIDYWKPKCNVKRAYISEAEKKEHKKEYYEDNIDKISEYQKEYKQNNREEINRKDREYYKDNKEKVLACKREYRAKNREEINRKDRERYAKKKLEKLGTIEEV